MSERLTHIVILVTVSVVLSTLISVLPIVTYHVDGRATDFIGNDHGFGLKLDGTIYWLAYMEWYWSKRNMDNTLIGKYFTLTYTTCLAFPHGAVSQYAKIIEMDVID